MVTTPETVQFRDKNLFHFHAIYFQLGGNSAGKALNK